MYRVLGGDTFCPAHTQLIKSRTASKLLLIYYYCGCGYCVLAARYHLRAWQQQLHTTKAYRLYSFTCDTCLSGPNSSSGGMWCRWVLRRWLQPLLSELLLSFTRQHRSLMLRATARPPTPPQTVRTLAAWVGAAQPSTHRGPARGAGRAMTAATQRQMQARLPCLA